MHTRSILPEHIQYDIRDEGFARCVAFNRSGSLFAAGCSDGRVVIWDFMTRAIVKIFVGHVQPVTVVRYAALSVAVSSLSSFISSVHVLTCSLSSAGPRTLANC